MERIWFQPNIILWFISLHQFIRCQITASFFESVTAEIAWKTKLRVSDIMIIRSSNSALSSRDFSNNALVSASVIKSFNKPTKILLQSADMLNFSKVFKKYLQSFHFVDACSIVVHENTQTASLLRGIIMDKILPGGVFRSFHIFNKEKGDTANLQALEIKYSSSIDFHQTSTVSYPSEGLFDTSRPNWRKKKLTMTITGMLIPLNVNLFKKTGKWDLGCMGYTYYTAQTLNATVNFFPIKTPANRKSSNVKGGLDAYVDPLLEGSKHIACKIFDPSMIPYGMVFLSKTTEYDRINFVTRIPKTMKIQSLFQSLAYPFDATLWGLTGISIAGVTVVVFTTMIVFDKNRCNSGRSILSIFSKVAMSVLRTAMDQPGFVSDIPSHVRRNSHSWHVILLWGSFASIILCNLYKSVLISALVKPDFAFVPKTIQKLVESSWKINAMLYNESLKVLFEEIDDSVSKVLLQKAKGVPFINGTAKCIRDIIDSNSVCMGHTSPVKLFSAQHLTDSQGRAMYRFSDDGIFSSFGAMGVSRKHPHVIETILYIQNAMETTGILRHWRAEGFAQTKKTGRNRSRLKNGTSLADKSSSDERHSDKDSWNLLSKSNLLEVQFMGGGLCLGVFLAELLIWNWILSVRKIETYFNTVKVTSF